MSIISCTFNEFSVRIHDLNRSKTLQYHGILFDLDGTLLDTAPDMVGAINSLLAEQGRPQLPYEVARPYVSKGSYALVQLGFGSLHETKKLDLVKQFLQHYERQIANQTALFTGLQAWLSSLDVASIPWGIVTNKPEYLTLLLLQKLSLNPAPHCVVAGDSLIKRKPHPMPVMHAAALMRMPPSECIFVGDAHDDIFAGKSAGMYTIAATYGYLTANDKPSLWGADDCVHSVSELIDIASPLLNVNFATPNRCR